MFTGLATKFGPLTTNQATPLGVPVTMVSQMNRKVESRPQLIGLIVNTSAWPV